MNAAKMKRAINKADVIRGMMQNSSNKSSSGILGDEQIYNNKCFSWDGFNNQPINTDDRQRVQMFVESLTADNKAGFR